MLPFDVLGRAKDYGSLTCQERSDHSALGENCPAIGEKHEGSNSIGSVKGDGGISKGMSDLHAA